MQSVRRSSVKTPYRPFGRIITEERVPRQRRRRQRELLNAFVPIVQQGLGD